VKKTNHLVTCEGGFPGTLPHHLITNVKLPTTDLGSLLFFGAG
jgi:hypothetical protein